MKLCELSTGDYVYRYYKSIVIPFNKPRLVMSTAPLNGGYREDLTAVFNHDCNPGAGMSCTLRAPTYEGHMRIVAHELGLEPDNTAGIATAASMENVAMRQESFDKLTVTAIVTGGVEVNGGRVGDPATYYEPYNNGKAGQQHGTINIILVIDANLPPGTMARALITSTEAKTAVLQELLAGSNYSTGIATGSGTDGTIIVANPVSPITLLNAGKHSKLGELIGRTVKDALKEALFRQTGLCPKSQHSVLKRLKRFGINEETLWQCYQQQTEGKLLSKADFIDKLMAIDARGKLVTYISLYVHLLDQYSWDLLSIREVEEGCKGLLNIMSGKHNYCLEEINTIEKCLEILSRYLISEIFN